jgi:hypothetical protein
MTARTLMDPTWVTSRKKPHTRTQFPHSMRNWQKIQPDMRKNAGADPKNQDYIGFMERIFNHDFALGVFLLNCLLLVKLLIARKVALVQTQSASLRWRKLKFWC